VAQRSSGLPGRARRWGDDSFDLRQAYIELGKHARHAVRIKMAADLVYGDERLVAHSIGTTWPHVRRRETQLQAPKWSVEAFRLHRRRAASRRLQQSDLFDAMRPIAIRFSAASIFDDRARAANDGPLLFNLHEDHSSRRQRTSSPSHRIKSKPGGLLAPGSAASDGKSVADGKSVRHRQRRASHSVWTTRRSSPSKPAS